MLEPLLEALRAERSGEPTVVHLLTNGVALTPERFARLCELGVSSWSVSIDGMSAATNDALRVGARIEVLLQRLASLCALKRARFAGARLGVAWTVTRANVAEIPQLIDYAAKVGLDWVKLEEMFPLDDLARAEEPAPELLRAALAKARTQALGCKVRLLEHVLDLAVFKCRLSLDPEVARFSELDDLANRMEINSCRLPFELICVEPDGDLKPLSFHHPVGGNLLREGLEAAWNSPPFVEARARSRSERPCGSGPTTCGSDPGPERW